MFRPKGRGKLTASSFIGVLRPSGATVEEDDALAVLTFCRSCASLGLESKVGFFGTGGAGFLAMLEETEILDAWLEARGLSSKAPGWA